MAKEGQRVRARRAAKMEARREKNRKAEWDAWELAEADCGECGFRDEVASMYESAQGKVCAPCFLRGEGHTAVEQVPSAARLALPPLLWAYLLAPAVSWKLTGIDPFGMHATLGQDLIVALWIPLFMTATFALPGVLGFLAARAWDVWRRPDLEEEDRRRGLAGAAWHAVVFFASVGGMWWALAMLR